MASVKPVPFAKCPPQPYHTRTYLPGMSYQFGPHTKMNKGKFPWVYFEGDNQVICQNSDEIPIERGQQPAWLIADWISNINRGVPVSEYALRIVIGAVEQNKGLRWLIEDEALEWLREETSGTLDRELFLSYEGKKKRILAKESGR